MQSTARPALPAMIHSQTENLNAAHAEAERAEQELALLGCAGGESFALLVQGQSMVPEFQEGEVILIEPEGLARDGSYVLAWHHEAWTFRQLLRRSNGWCLHALNPAFSDQDIHDLSCVKGVIIQKALPGRRKASKFYV